MARTFNAAALTGQSRLDIALFTLGWGAVMGAGTALCGRCPDYGSMGHTGPAIIAFWEGRLNWDLLAGQHNDSAETLQRRLGCLGCRLRRVSSRRGVFVTLVLGAVITVGFACSRRTGLGALGAACLAAVYTGLSLAPRS